MKAFLPFVGALCGLSASVAFAQADAPGKPDNASRQTKPDRKMAEGVIADSPQNAKPLGVGVTAPDILLTSVDGKPVKLGSLLKKQPTALIFYRGGWCPFCNMHLAQLKTIEPDLRALGYQIVAVSPDRPEELRKTMDKHQLDYTLLSDSDAKALKAYGVAFKVDDETVEKYRAYHVDLEASAGGRAHHALPVPSVFLIGKDRVIQFAHSNPDYKVRLAPDKILAAARAAQATPAK